VEEENQKLAIVTVLLASAFGVQQAINEEAVSNITPKFALLIGSELFIQLIAIFFILYVIGLSIEKSSRLKNVKLFKNYEFFYDMGVSISTVMILVLASVMLGAKTAAYLDQYNFSTEIGATIMAICLIASITLTSGMYKNYIEKMSEIIEKRLIEYE